MSGNTANLDARLGYDHFEIDTENSHIRLDEVKCRACVSKPCLVVCPAQVYLIVEDALTARYENCLECGTCQVACDGCGNGGLTWCNPVNGLGIQFRKG